MNHITGVLQLWCPIFCCWINGTR